MADNERLRRYYEELGFRCCGVAGYGGYTSALFELDLDQASDAHTAPRAPA
jgi:hypothetical protein